MKISEVMTKDVRVVQPSTNLEEAARIMRDLNVGSVPVCDGRKIHGMLTDRDITIRATAEGRDPRATTAGEIMSSGIVYCYEDNDVREAAKLMSEHQIRRLPIVDRSHNLVGIVSLGDVSVQTDNERLGGETLESISQPGKPSQS